MIKIHNTWAQIGLNTSQAIVGMQISHPVLKLRQDLLKVELEQEQARVKLDSTRCREEIGLKDTVSFSRDNAQKGYEACFSYTGRIAQQGDMMARPDKFALGSILKACASKVFPELDFNVAKIPRSPVDVTVLPATTETDWRLGEVKGEYQPGEMVVKTRGGQVEVYLRQQASLDISYEPQVDLYG